MDSLFRARSSFGTWFAGERSRGGPLTGCAGPPKPGEWLGYLFGTVWVDSGDFGVLRIEWSQESLESYGRLRSSAQDRNFKPDIVLAGEYGYEKNGLRFPSRFDVDERYIYSDPLKFSLYTLAVVFSDYKFFTVETEVKY